MLHPAAPVLALILGALAPGAAYLRCGRYAIASRHVSIASHTRSAPGCSPRMAAAGAGAGQPSPPEGMQETASKVDGDAGAVPDSKETTPLQTLAEQISNEDHHIKEAEKALKSGGSYLGWRDEQLRAYVDLRLMRRQDLSMMQLMEKIQLAQDAVVPTTDDSSIHANRLFKPFDDAEFPRQLDISRLRAILTQPPASPVPVPSFDIATLESKWPRTLHPGRPLFVSATQGENPRQLLLILEYALTIPQPDKQPTELQLTGFWHCIGWHLPALAASMLSFNVVVSRADVDETIMLESKQRDYMVLLYGVLCIGGEEKADSRQYASALSECTAKHLGANAAMYGKLGYILLVVVAGDKLGVHAIALEQKSKPQMIVEHQIGGFHGRRNALLTFINIIRWLRTVHTMSLLPPAPVLTFLQPVYRPSPYISARGLQLPDSELVLHHSAVFKTVWVPPAYVQDMLDVYGMLNTGIAGALRCSSFKIGDTPIQLEHPMRQVTVSTEHTDQKLTLELTPVGAGWHLEHEAALWQLCHDVLTILGAVHERGFVHRDVRSANILYHTSGYFLVDWEAVGRIGDRVFWWGKAEHMPPGVQIRSAWEPWIDLWQLGKVMKEHVYLLPKGSDGRRFMNELLDGAFATGTEALRSFWQPGQ
eukprot:TRINITY_DN786_c0_g1_i1.p1 TRINITY_DN786_c0_g1~~TRINITY_DN786_c0_g1_i1.p1  ORF type:complete len:750 (-),score=93.69 TRINITY_DN786_c0_g1_i1:75-2021(-)